MCSLGYFDLKKSSDVKCLSSIVFFYYLLRYSALLKV